VFLIKLDSFQPCSVCTDRTACCRR